VDRGLELVHLLHSRTGSVSTYTWRHSVSGVSRGAQHRMEHEGPHTGQHTPHPPLLFQAPWVERWGAAALEPTAFHTHVVPGGLHKCQGVVSVMFLLAHPCRARQATQVPGGGEAHAPHPINLQQSLQQPTPSRAKHTANHLPIYLPNHLHNHLPYVVDVNTSRTCERAPTAQAGQTGVLSSSASSSASS
jgi:hypothetical protein